MKFTPRKSTLAERVASEVRKGSNPLKPATVRKAARVVSAKPQPVLSKPAVVAKGSELARWLGMTDRQARAEFAAMNVPARLELIEQLGTTLRRINALLADRDGVSPNQAQSLTAGEAGLVGLAKLDSTQGQRALREHQTELERVLETVLGVHEEMKREAELAKRNSLPLSRGVPRTLDQLEAWAEARADLAERLNYQPDPDGGASALGLSKHSQAAAGRIEKSRSTMLPADSYNGTDVNLAEQLAKSHAQRAELQEGAPLPWFMRVKR
jgi:hypothetical protein